jgi:hypothetical protein
MLEKEIGEQTMEQLLLKKRIYQVPVPPDTIQGWEDDMARQRAKWGHYFKNNGEFELFAMLPLTEEQRWKVLQAVAEEKKFHDEVSTCTGKTGSSHEHRKKCIECCLVDKQQKFMQ